MANKLITPERIRQALIDWISETDNSNIELLYNENFDNLIMFDHELGMFVVPEEEVKRVGLDT